MNVSALSKKLHHLVQKRSRIDKRINNLLRRLNGKRDYWGQCSRKRKRR